MRFKKRLANIVCLAATAVFVFLQAASLADNGIRTVVLTDDEVPGTPAGTSYSIFRPPTLNSVGEVAFNASLNGGSGGVTANNNNGIWAESNNTLGLAVRKGDQAPGLPAGNVFTQLPADPIYNRRGDIAFQSKLYDTPEGEEVEGIWKKLAGSPLQAVEVEIDFDPFSYGDPVLNNAGETAFEKSSFDSNTGEYSYSVRSEGGGSLSTVFSLSEFGSGIYRPSLNDFGETAFLSRTDEAVSTFRSEGGGILHTVATEGSAAPGGPPGAVFGFDTLILSVPGFNNAGEITFYGNMAVGSGGVTTDDQFGVWSEGGGALRLVARQGEQPPGVPAGAKYDIFFPFRPLLDNDGDVVFQARLEEGFGGVNSQNKYGIWSEGGGSLHLVAREGDPVPGGLPGEVFSSNLGYSINSSGRVLVTDLTAGRIFAEDCNFELQPIAKYGDIIDVDDGPGVDNRMVTGASATFSSGTQEGRATSFNDKGQVAFSASFADGSSGVFVSDAVAITILEADFDEDGDVDEDDLLVWENGFGTSNSAFHGDGDADEDGDVDGMDFLIWQQQFGSTTECNGSLLAGQAIPEPSTFSLLSVVLGSSLVLIRKRCTR